MTFEVVADKYDLTRGGSSRQQGVDNRVEMQDSGVSSVVADG